ncbi:hypothetical protein BpHYR1_033354 [Brachionus plicatilis]|uniref:Uncharacterized protein n=1 Tax=Brachionus plicatilis TaxID=10195 RepID=A0A3M7PX27_BRAPC|nr:hypothetical protein BpHYR1_033354 [Brachionus plicatilis]
MSHSITLPNFSKSSFSSAFRAADDSGQLRMDQSPSFQPNINNILKNKISLTCIYSIETWTKWLTKKKIIVAPKLLLLLEYDLFLFWNVHYIN